MKLQNRPALSAVAVAAAGAVAAFIATAMLAIAIAIPLPASAHEAHVHGVGRLDIAIDGDLLTLHLDTPLANLLGVEHPPRTAAEREAAMAMSRQLRRPATLFVPTPAAQCAPQAVTLAAGALLPALLDPDAPAAGSKVAAKATAAAAPPEHADLDADFSFRCARPALLRSLRVTLFEHFPGFHRIDAQIVTPLRQSAATLAPGAAAVDF